MRELRYKMVAGVFFAVFSPALLAATPEETMAIVTKVMMYVAIAFAIVVILGVYFMRSRDKRRAPLNRIFERSDAIHAVAPDTLITECVRLMTTEKIGALVVMEGERLQGIFTERDALNKVLAAGLAPGSTKVSQVMTKDPHCVGPTTTVADAMELVTRRRFRHLPVVENGKLLAVVSSGDLTRWLIQDKMPEVQELVGFAVES
jgi:CBS domain-containing protein